MGKKTRRVSPKSTTGPMVLRLENEPKNHVPAKDGQSPESSTDGTRLKGVPAVDGQDPLRGRAQGVAPKRVTSPGTLKKRVLLGLTGASGAIFADQFARRYPGETYLIPTRWGKKVFESELGKPVESLEPFVKTIYDEDNLFVPFASGSVDFHALVILPCSVSTMAKIAHGIADNLLTRVAQVALKEKRRIIFGLREAPLSTIALRNATVLSETGAVIFPLCLSYYFKPRTMEDMINSLIDRIFGLLGENPGRGFLAEELE